MKNPVKALKTSAQDLDNGQRNFNICSWPAGLSLPRKINVLFHSRIGLKNEGEWWI